MSKQDNFGEDNSYITYNSLISISHISSEENDKLKTTKYIMRKEDFCSFLVFKKINKSKFDYLNLSDSLFFIRDIEECNSIYGNKTKDNEDSICSKEVHFSKNDKLNQNSKFILQHMLSRKFVTCIMNIKNNTITLKLVKDVENTYPFTLEKINQNRNAVGDLKFNQIFFLNVYIEEENMNYYVEEEELCELKRVKSHLNILPKIEDEIEDNNEIKCNKEYDEIVLNKKPISGIYLINQTYIINDKINIYYGHLLNIIFTRKYLEKDEEKMMLCLKEKEHKFFNKNNNINNLKSKKDAHNENHDELNKNNYEISACVYTSELCDQVLNNALWVIESDLFYHKGGLNIKLINIEENFRLRNALTGFYLDIKPKSLSSIKNILISNIFLESEKYEFQFYLIDGNKIEENLFFPYNFKLCHYIISDENTHVINDGKYILKGIFQNMDKEHVFKKEVDGNKFYYVDVDKYYLPISLYFKSGNIKRSIIKESAIFNQNAKKNFILTIKNENDFIFNIKQIDTLTISQVIYIRKIILQLGKDLKNNHINLNSLNERVLFLKEYLINIDYSFKDENQEKNSPISERQKLLWKFNIVNILVSVIDYCLEKLSNNNELIKSQKFFLENVKGLFSYLAKGEEAIKISIYVLALKKIFNLEESLSDDCSKLVHFIFDLVHHSEILQTYLIGDSSQLKKYIQNDSCLSKMNIDIDNLINKNDILKLIETNPNFLLSYQNLLILNKVQYKKNDIIADIKRHYQQIKFKEENNHYSEKLNYLQSIDEHYNQIKKLIKNNAILINKFLNQPSLLTRGKNKLRTTKFFSSIVNLGNNNLNKKASTIVSIKEMEHSKSQIFKQSTIKTEEINLEVEDNDNNQYPKMDTYRPLISQESKEADNNFQNMIKERNSCTISKDKEKQILLKSPSIEEKNIIKRSSLGTPRVNKFQYKRTPSNFITSLKKTKGQEKEKYDDNPVEEEKKLKLRYKNTLNNFGKIWAFIKWYKTFGFEELICILDDLLKQILNEDIDYQSKPLYYFIKYKKSSTFLDKNLRINSSTRVGVLYLLRLFNHLFKISKSELDEKILNKENISYKEILDDMDEKEEILDKPYEKYQSLNDFDINLNKDINEIDERMGVFYSTYQFYINQYVKMVHKVLSILSNYLINQETFDSIEKIKICFMKTIDILLSKVVFLNDTTIGFLYSRARRNPTILGGVFNYKELIEHSIEIIINNFKKLKQNQNQNQSITNFFIQEKILIDYLYSMCRECDEIKCLYEKIVCLKYMRDFIFSRENMIENLSEDKFNEEVKKQFKNMLKLIWEKKRIKILLAYEEYNSKSKYHLTEKQKKDLKNINLKFEQVDFWENYFYESFKVGDITKFTLKLLQLYEIDEFFGNILYFDRTNNDYFFEKEDRSIKKIRKLISKISKIESLIINLKINLNKDENINNNNTINDSSFLFESDNYKALYHSLAQITTDSLEVFNFELYNFNSKNLLYKMLLMENKLFYQKIEFLESLKNMIQAINYFKINVDNNILGYISNLLRIFSQMIIMYPNFSSKIKPNFEIFSFLVISAFHLISKYPNYLVNQNVEAIFLEIIYRGMLIFYYIVKNSFMTFKDIKEFMENVFLKIQLVFEKFKSEKNRYIFRILYLFCVTRILLYLYNDKTYDSLSYKEFYEKIFQISDINSFFSNNLKKENNDSTSSSGKMETIKEEVLSQKESNLSERDKKAKGNIFFDLNNFPEEMHPVKLENSNNLDISDEENSNKVKNNLDLKTEPSQELDDEDKKNNDNNDLLINNTFDWYDEEEIKILSFYVSFLFIYSSYLNEKNSQISEFEEDNFDTQETPIEEISLDIFLKKIKNFLSPKTNQANTPQQQQINQTYDVTMFSNTTRNNSIDVTKLKVEPSALDFNCIEDSSTEQTENEFKESVIKPQHLFIFALLQAILNFKHSSRNHPIEIPIKHNVSKLDSSNDIESEDIIPNETDSLFDKESYKSSIIFYYYESSHIDIILLEKIITEIALKVNIKNYCLELTEGENERIPPLLKELLHNLNYYKLMFNYQIKEYNLVNNLFVKNNLALLIKKIFSMFKFDDLKEISQMNYFMFKKMGEVYNEELIKQEDDNDHKNINLIEFLQFNEVVNKDFSKKINILSFLESLIYIDRKNEKICLILYKMGFQLLYNKCSSINKQKDDEEGEVDLSINILNIIKIMISLFQKEKYKKILEDDYVFGTMILSLKELLQLTSEKIAFFLKQLNLIKEFFNSLDFILGHLSIEFVETMKFLRRPENLIESNNFHIHKIKLETNLEFFITLLNFQKKFEEKIMSEKIIDFEKKFIKRVIKLIFLILEIEKEKSIEIINILIDFLFEFIKGPDIDNLNMIFSLGFFDLISYTIKNIDYYKLFLNYVNKENMHKMIDSYIKIECKIIKFFIIYYNISFSPKNSIEYFSKLQQWYETNFKNIIKKLKKLYYISEKEMEGREYCINKMLLSIKINDSYTNKELCKRIGVSFSNQNNNKDNKINNVVNANQENNENQDNNKCQLSNIDNENNVKQNSDYCIIKFDILLSYYILFNYHKNLSDKDKKFKFALKHKNNIFVKIALIIFHLIYDFFKFIIGTISIIIPFMYYIFNKCVPKSKKDVDLLQDLQDIDIKCENIREEKIINFLKNYIRKSEVSIKNIIYKVYFPMIDTANTLAEYRKEYLKVDEIDSADFINYLLSQYDYIYMKAKQNSKIDRWIGEIPILSYIFKNMNMFAVFLILTGFGSTFLILSSFNTFTTRDERECGKNFIVYRYARPETRLQCPRFLYQMNYDPKKISIVIFIFILLQCILQGLTFLNYLIRKIFIESEIVKFNYISGVLRKYGTNADTTISKWNFFLHIVLPTFLRSLFNIQTIYYLISLTFLILSSIVHPFFNCIILLELVYRVEVMQNILKAMYRPSKNILIILLMFIILEYFFSFLAQSYFTLHFPNIIDTKNFLKTFMRMIDQTFKQDGGIGTYLDKALEPNYSPHEITNNFINRFFFDIIFFLVVVSLIFQMFLSVIIDYFNETRERSETFNETMETECIICGIDREKIEKIFPNDKMAFDKHITNCHNVFSYLYYLMYLQSNADKDVIIDEGVWNLHLDKNLSYLPKNEFFKNLERKRCEKYNSRKKDED